MEELLELWEQVVFPQLRRRVAARERELDPSALGEAEVAALARDLRAQAGHRRLVVALGDFTSATPSTSSCSSGLGSWT